MINLPRIQASLWNGSLQAWLTLSTIVSQTKIITLIIQEVEKSSHSEAMPEFWGHQYGIFQLKSQTPLVPDMRWLCLQAREPDNLRKRCLLQTQTKKVAGTESHLAQRP